MANLKYSNNYWDMAGIAFLVFLGTIGFFYLIGLVVLGLISFLAWKSILFIVWNWMYLRIAIVCGLLVAIKFIYDDYNGI